MDHRGHREAERVAAQAERIAFLDSEGAAFQRNPFEELGKHLQGGGCRHERHGRIAFQHPGHERRVVGFHVVDYQIVGRAVSEGFGQVGLPGFALPGVGRVEDGGLVVEDYV